MKITDVACHILQCKVDKPFVSARGWVYGTRSTCVVEISTDEGITGWGECYGPAAVAKTFIETQYKARVVGRDPFDVEAIWEDLYNGSRTTARPAWRSRPSPASTSRCGTSWAARSNKPVHKLIGGAYRSEVIPYATGLYFIDMNRLVEEAVEEALEFKNDGFRAIKMKIGLGDLKLDAKRVAAVRKAIGPDVKLAVDANHCFSVPNAIKLGRMLEEHDILWFEEPISPEDHDGYIEVTRALDMAVAGGENDFTRWGFRDVIAKKAMDIVQPDLCAAGGFSECRKIATLASASASNACRMPGARRSGSPRRCSSSRRCPTSRRPSGRCRRCSSSSRRPTRCAITWRRSRSSRRRAS